MLNNLDCMRIPNFLYTMFDIFLFKCWLTAIFFLQFGRTEMIKDTLNPDFVHKFLMNYFFEESQKLKFEM